MTPARVLALVFGLAPSVAGAASERPNVLIVRTDDQDLHSLDVRRPDGSPVMREVLAGIAARGVSFTSCHVTSPLCGPSRASVLTGRYAHNHGVEANEPPHGGFAGLAGDETLPVWLQRAGYFTMHVGKYVNGYEDFGGPPGMLVPPGWSRWFALLAQPNTFHYYDYLVNEDGALVHFGGGAGHYETDVLTRKALEHLVTRPYGDRPFFLTVDYSAPHGAGFTTPPYSAVPAPRHQGAMDSAPFPRPASFNELDVSDKPAEVRALPLVTVAEESELATRFRRRMESLMAVDEGVGRILAMLDATGQLANTLVVFTSDNGFYLGEHRIQSTKRFPYEATRVPLLVRGPGIAPGSVCGELVANVDLAPTILELAQATAGLPQDGLSLVPLLHGAPSLARDAIVVELPSEMHYTGLRVRGNAGVEHLYLEYDYDDDGRFDERELYRLVPDACGTIGDPDLLSSAHGDPCAAALLDEFHARLAILRHCRGEGCR